MRDGVGRKVFGGHLASFGVTIVQGLNQINFF
jgi:hypothetical protein